MSQTSDETKAMMQLAIDHLDTELQNIRTGRANPGILEGVTVEVYGTQMKLKEIANVTSPESRQLLVTTFDHANAGPTYSALEKANLGFKLSHEGNTVRVTVPPMDDTLRKEMVKMCHRRREEAKVSIRNARRDANEAVRKAKADGDIGEDILHKEEKLIQELTDEFCIVADKKAEVKEKEVSTI